MAHHIVTRFYARDNVLGILFTRGEHRICHADQGRQVGIGGPGGAVGSNAQDGRRLPVVQELFQHPVTDDVSPTAGRTLMVVPEGAVAFH